MTALFGLLALVLLVWLVKGYVKADPRKVAVVLKLSGGIAALAFAAFLGARGALYEAIPLAFLGLSLLGWLPFGPAGFGARTQRSGGQVSRVRSAFLEMELDHDSGAMRGVILAGPYEGQRLEALEVSTLIGLLGEIDEESRALLGAYLDRRDPAWRERAQAGTGAGRGGAARGSMTREEAYEVLGLEPGAKAEEIVRAYRTLIMKVHPDHGGTGYLAERITEAKDTLLRNPR